MLFVDLEPEQKSQECFEEQTDDFAVILRSTFDEFSEDDLEDDQPVVMNTNRNVENKSSMKCAMPWCDYNTEKGWKHLTKHCVRQHEGKYNLNSQLSQNFNPQELKGNTAIATKGPNGLLFQSHCYICNEIYNMSSEKWLMHYIAHTGECQSEIGKLNKLK